MTKSSVTCSYPIAVVIPLCSDSAWKRRGNSPRPYYLPLVWRHANGYLHEVFSSCGSNSPAERVSPRGESEGRVAVKIGGGGGLLCFTSEEQQGEKKKNVPKARIRCRIAKAEGKSTRRAASLASENGATRRGRARLCGGEHREEAQQKGLSQEHRRTFLHICTRREEHRFLSGCCIPPPNQMMPKMTVHCRVHFAA